MLTVLEGIARVHGTAPGKKVALLRKPVLELVDLRVEDLSPSPDGLCIRIKRSKTDQQGAGYELLVLYAQPPRPCTVRAVRAWLDHAQITDGPILRRVTRTGTISTPLTAQSVPLIIKRRARAAGLNPADFDCAARRSADLVASPVRSSAEEGSEWAGRAATTATTGIGPHECAPSPGAG